MLHTLLCFLLMLSSQARADDFTILFTGGADPYRAGEYSQLAQFSEWKSWADSRSKSSNITIFSDGTSSTKLFEELKSAPMSSEKDLGWSPNVRTYSPETGHQLKKYGVKDNFGPANLDTLNEAFSQIPKEADSVTLFVGDHGASQVTAGLKELGLGDQVAKQESAIVGWMGAKSSHDVEPYQVGKDGRVNWVITTQDLVKLREKYAGSKKLKFVMTQCFSGGFMGLAMQKDKTHLRGDTCGAMAAPFYYQSSGCDSNADVKYGYGYWASQALKRRPDFDKNGDLSLFDIHYFALVNDEYDRTPQLTTEIFLQQQGFLKWPTQEGKINRGEIPLSENKAEADAVCNSPECKAKSKLLENVAGVVEASDPVLLGLNATRSKDNSKFVDEAIQHYKGYAAAEKAYLSQASEKDAQVYLKVKDCERERL